MALIADLLKGFGRAALDKGEQALKLVSTQVYAGNPTNNLTPDHVGQICIDTTNHKAYAAETLASSSWMILN